MLIEKLRTDTKHDRNSSGFINDRQLWNKRAQNTGEFVWVLKREKASRKNLQRRRKVSMFEI